MMSKKTRTRLFLLVTVVMLLTVVMLAACEDDSEVITLSFTIKNETEYEMQKILFVGDNSQGRGNPYVFLTIVGSADSDDTPLSDVPLASGEERIFTVSLSEKILNGTWAVEVEASEVELGSDNKSLSLNENVKGFVVFYAEETDFVFAPFYQ